MRMTAYVITAVLSAALPGIALAQSAPPAAVPSAAPPIDVGPTKSHWLLAGFVGSNFGSSATDQSVAFGGQLAYLWKGVAGVETIVDLNPSFRLDNLLLAENPRANAYMANAIFAMPVGASGQFQPYVSGGVGGIQLVAKVFNIALPHPSGTFPLGTTEGDQFRLGTNIGGVLMGFAGMIGFRADARYYSASSSERFFTPTTPVGEFAQTLFQGLHFWRANIGVALRW